MVCIVTKVYFTNVVVVVVLPFSFDIVLSVIAEFVSPAFVDALAFAIVLKREYLVSFLADVKFALSVSLLTPIRSISSAFSELN